MSDSVSTLENGARFGMHLRLLRLWLRNLAETLYRAGRGKGNAGEI
ncbi:MAG: hypothetical protein PVF76_04760 [Syntrophobacterales bacterium]